MAWARSCMVEPVGSNSAQFRLQPCRTGAAAWAHAWRQIVVGHHPRSPAPASCRCWQNLNQSDLKNPRLGQNPADPPPKLPTDGNGDANFGLPAQIPLDFSLSLGFRTRLRYARRSRVRADRRKAHPPPSHPAQNLGRSSKTNREGCPKGYRAHSSSRDKFAVVSAQRFS